MYSKYGIDGYACTLDIFLGGLGEKVLSALAAWRVMSLLFHNCPVHILCMRPVA